MAKDEKTIEQTDKVEETPTTDTSAAATPDTKDISAKIKSGKKKKAKIKLTKGNIYITSTYNNTIVAVTDTAGNVIAWGSAGKAGFKGSKKSTPYAGGKTMEDTLARVKDRGLVEVDVFIKGIGSGRESAVRALQGSGLNVLSIKDRT